jgi:hypothetical protein
MVRGFRALVRSDARTREMLCKVSGRLARDLSSNLAHAVIHVAFARSRCRLGPNA